MSYSIGKVAELAGVTVRTLHHYDEIGLLSPSDRTSTGYRRYDDADLERLQQIRYYRELEFSLEEIAAILDDPKADATSHLRRQHQLLTERITRLEKMVNAIEFAMEATKVGIKLTPQERFEVWGDFDPDQYAEEAEQRWGDTDAYQESVRKTSQYTKEDWLRIKEQSEDWGRRIVAVMDSGAAADSPEAMELAEEHRQHISQWYYECSYEIQTGLAEMYLADERFMATYEAIKPGLTVFLHDAIMANAVARS
ncbi:MAG TPA: MerR family transcriptional regulator [Micromonosporaceae bacterium]|nr:MerR family transcriptional regulator [Micromonosporaceae bacterium]HCU49769.1 MerR family transcriptional regulator [Micromonosporaceae bacterium]